MIGKLLLLLAGSAAAVVSLSSEEDSGIHSLFSPNIHRPTGLILSFFFADIAIAEEKKTALDPNEFKKVNLSLMASMMIWSN